MMPEWKYNSKSRGSFESIGKVISMHMGKCNKAAMILSEKMALQLFAILKAAKQPVFFGKDVINENLYGFKYFGYFPQTLLLNTKFSFNSGIIEWWKKYLKWFLGLKTNQDIAARNLTELSGLSNSAKTNDKASGVYILSLIPGIGLMVSLIVFIFYDCNLFKNTLCGIRDLIKSIYNSKFFQKDKTINCFDIRANQHNNNIKRFSLPEILLEKEAS